jgi:putative endonuclease
MTYGKKYYLYILTNKSNTLYTGVTNNLLRRINEHHDKNIKCFTNIYNLNKLVYFEEFDDPIAAISAEKRVKGWNRKKKIELIKTINPKFRDLLE